MPDNSYMEEVSYLTADEAWNVTNLINNWLEKHPHGKVDFVYLVNGV